MKIKFPKGVTNNAAIGICAPSNGLPQVFHKRFECAIKQFRDRGYQIVIDPSIYQSTYGESLPAKERAEVLSRMLFDEKIDVIMPPWGGDFLIEIFPYMDFNAIASLEPKWIHGYSDISTLLLSVTTKLGWATSHGPNILDLASEKLDLLTDGVFEAMGNGNYTQSSSEYYQVEWPKIDKPNSNLLLTERTKWNIHNWDLHPIKGRLLGGCLDTIMRLVGTKYLPINQFQDEIDLKIIWYFESAYMSPEDIFRCIYQGYLLGWFENCGAVLIGRISPKPYRSVNIDVQLMAKKCLQWINVPIFTECDIGHYPPQLTLINGALTEIKFDNSGSISLNTIHK